MSEFKTIETQEELDRIIGERLSRQKEKFADYEDLKSSVKKLEQKNADLLQAIDNNNQLLKEREEILTAKETEFSELQKVVDGYKFNQLRTQVALKYGIPYELAERLQGADEESLQADAEKLSALMKPKPTAPLKEQEPVVGEERTNAMRQMLRDLNNN